MKDGLVRRMDGYEERTVTNMDWYGDWTGTKNGLVGFSWELRFPGTLNFLGDLLLEAQISCKKQATRRNRLLRESGS